jgi:hypothetical protein
MLLKIRRYKSKELSKVEILESFQGWQAYARWADTLNLRRKVVRKIYAPF